MPLNDLLSSFGTDIEDPEEETFLLFSQQLPSQDLGFVDAKATSLEVTVGRRELNIQQSPSILSSNREGALLALLCGRSLRYLRNGLRQTAMFCFGRPL